MQETELAHFFLVQGWYLVGVEIRVEWKKLLDKFFDITVFKVTHNTPQQINAPVLRQVEI